MLLDFFLGMSCTVAVVVVVVVVVLAADAVGAEIEAAQEQHMRDWGAH